MRFIATLHHILFFFGVTMVVAFSALAQDSVLVRGGDHDDYSRLVFEWSSPTGYVVQTSGNTATITFKKPAVSDFIAMPESLRNIKNVGEVSEAGKNLSISMTIPAGSNVRDLVIGNKVVLDVYDSSVPEKEAKTPEKPKKEEPQKTAEDFTVKTAEPAKPVPAAPVEVQPIPENKMEPHTLTLTTVTSVGMAVYQRHGYLWMVVDQPDLQVAPVLDGPSKEKFGALEKTDLKDADLYKLELPDGVAASVEGGGLSWKVTIGPKAAPQPVAMTPVREAADKGNGLLWPMPNLRKTISFNDPISGDSVTAITATNAAPASGRARAFVDFQTYDTYAGLVLTPKRDGVKTSVSAKGAMISRDGGLMLSDAEDLQTQEIRNAAESKKPDTKPEEPKDGAEKAKDNLALTEPPPEAKATKDIEKEIHEDNVIVDTAEIAKATQEKPTGNNIYNFAKWEMGGVRKLQNNMHALMAEVAAKPPSEQTEDIITMAKLLLANNRAPEALGMLRIAKQQLPELEGTPEFDSLLAAAMALSGKYDEAIVIFAREDLQKFDDVKLWRAFTLSGLQDWKQAGNTMPSSLAAVQSYPFEIRTVLTLAFAETALRNAKAPKARSLLDGMKADLDKLSLADLSSWKYLAGETERQSGNMQKAKEYWEPLVNRGRDDLFRAKAGLSLTRLQIDQKTLKPEEAINRLEGLRYAWRGDELETLINYRLGQLYIDNKDFLKGLTVLRNASTMTPDLQIGQDVKALMQNTFRDVFVKDHISKMSPIDAISFYEEFKDQTPPGEESIQYVEKLAERLVEADLLGRAAALLDYQVNNRLQGAKKVEIAIRLAAIRLLDGNPDGALRSLDIAQSTIDKMTGASPEPAKTQQPKPENIETQAGEATKTQTLPKPEDKQVIDPEKQREIYLLKARALSMKKKPEEALAILEGMRIDPDVNRLRTDIAWMAGKWEEAAMALNDLILAEDISGRRPLTEYQQDIILNRAIALNLSGNRVALANLRERYVAQMKETPKGKMFEVVTRPRRPDMIGSREAIETMMSEIDLFKGFLDSYAKAQSPEAKNTKEVDPPKDPVGAQEVKPEKSQQTTTEAQQKAEEKAEEKAAP